MDEQLDSYLILLMIIILYETEEHKWDTYREKAKNNSDTVKLELKNYFENAFRNNIPQYILPAKTKLYRARIIRSEDYDKIGVNPFKDKKLVEIFLSEDDIKKIEENKDLFISYDKLIYIKTKWLTEITEEQLKKLKKLLVKYCKKGFYGFNRDECGVPPKNFRTNGRLNTKNDPYLYMAMDKNTAIYEMRPSIKQTYSLAECKTITDLTLADLSNTQMREGIDMAFSIISSKTSEPNTENKDDFYNITQCLSHIIDEYGYDGILYQSSLNKDGKNALLFCEDNVEFISSEIVTVDNVHIDYSTIYPVKINEDVKNFVRTSYINFTERIGLKNILKDDDKG